MYDFNTLMFFGKYKCQRLGNIPANHFLKLWEGRRKMKDLEMKEFIRENLDLIKERGVKTLNPTITETFICEKRTFATQTDAKHSLSKIRQVNEGSDKPIRAYECDKCSGWHLTSMPIEIFKTIPND